MRISAAAVVLVMAFSTLASAQTEAPEPAAIAADEPPTPFFMRAGRRARAWKISGGIAIGLGLAVAIGASTLLDPLHPLALTGDAVLGAGHVMLGAGAGYEGGLRAWSADDFTVPRTRIAVGIGLLALGVVGSVVAVAYRDDEVVRWVGAIAAFEGATIGSALLASLRGWRWVRRRVELGLGSMRITW